MIGENYQNLYFGVIPENTCPRCFDTNLWLTPANMALPCPRKIMGENHAEPNHASLILKKACERMNRKNLYIFAQEFELARILTHYTSEQPCGREHLFDFFYADTNLDDKTRLRKFHELVESLRKVWLLPVGSRKSEPCGYWMITNLNDYKAWIDKARTAPITQLSTIHKNARFNYPEFAEQLELEFWQDIEPEQKEVLV